MTLQELLTELRQNVLHDRSSQVAGDSDKLWDDTTLIRYLNEAQMLFARKTCCIRDNASPFTLLQTTAYESTYALDPSIIAIYSMRFLGNSKWVNGQLIGGTYGVDGVTFTPNAQLLVVPPDSADLGRGGHAQFQQYPRADRLFFNPAGLSEELPGKPMAFGTDESFGPDTGGSTGVINLRLYPMPSPQYAGCYIRMRVARMPLKPLVPGNLNLVPEIPDMYHLSLVDYAASRALAIVDHDLGDPQRAADFGAKFTAEIEDVREEMMRRAFVPMVWGFGRNGYGYEGN